MKIDAVILDFDGTIVDSEPIWKIVIGEVFVSLGHKISPEIMMLGSGMGINQSVAMIIEKLDIKNADASKIVQQICENVYTKIINEAKVHPGFLTLVQCCKDNNLPLAVCTSSELTMVLPTLERINATEMFEVIHSAHGYANMKPHPEPYLLTAEKLGVDINQCVVVEDSIPGIKAGTASGAKTFAIPYEHDLEQVTQMDVEIAKDLGIVASRIEFMLHDFSYESPSL